MRGIFQSLLLFIAQASDRELAIMVQYLKAENRVLRSKLPKRIEVTPREKETLLKYGRPAGAKIKELIAIVSPRTFARWVNAEKTIVRRPSAPKGRPRTPEQIREVVLRLARENHWGYTRILGELKKLGVHKICRSTVVNILRQHGLQPQPRRAEETWDEFIRRHGQTLWACDFFTKKVWTMQGLFEVYILFFLQVNTRRVYLAGQTPNPDRAWVHRQAQNFAASGAGLAVRPALLLRDNDQKFGPEFDAVLEAEGVDVRRVGPLAPNLNAYCERFVQTAQVECLDRFIVFGQAHLRHLLHEFLVHYHECRPHQGIGNVTPAGPAPPDPSPLDPREVVCEERLGGLLKHYRRRAA
jgi:putative transposase